MSQPYEPFGLEPAQLFGIDDDLTEESAPARTRAVTHGYIGLLSSQMRLYPIAKT
jgi:hypothetical protein